MVREAEEHADEDKAAHEAAQLRNQADSMVYGMERNLKDWGEKIGDDDRQAIESAMADVKKALESGDSQEIKSALERLETASHKMSEAMYREAASAGAADASDGGAQAEEAEEPAQDGEVVDAEFEVEEEEKPDDGK